MLVMVKIGVLSDTHLESVTEDFKRHITHAFPDIDVMLHAGDMTSMVVFEFLNNWDIRAVRGNMDDADLHSLLPEKRIEEIYSKKIGIVHGRGAPFGIEDTVYSEFQDVDVVVYGHSHIPLFSKRGKTFIFNPGAYKASYMNKGTFGIIEIRDDIKFTHIEVS